MGRLLTETPGSELHATWEVFDRLGITRQHLARLRAEPNYAKRVAEFMLRGGVEGSIHQKLARAILGENFFGIEEWSSLYGVNFTKKQLREIADFPWSEDVLNAPCPFVKGKKVKETHFAFLGLNSFKGKPLTILKWQELHPASKQPQFYSYAPDCWYGKEEFVAKKTSDFRWHLMSKEIVPDSTNKTYQEQTKMLPNEYEVPFAVEEVAKEILYFKKNGVYLNPNRYARCQDLGSSGARVYIGFFSRYGLCTGSGWDGCRFSRVGLATSRKFPAQIES